MPKKRGPMKKGKGVKPEEAVPTDKSDTVMGVDVSLTAPEPRQQPVASFANATNVLPTDQEFAAIERILDILEEAKQLPYERPVARAVALKGWELGIRTMNALTVLVPKEGQIAFERAEYMRQMVSRAGGALIPVESTDRICRLKALRRVYGQVIEGEYSYSVQDALSAGRLGRGDFYDTHRKDMLYARCTSRAARGMFADVIAGVFYTVDELEDLSASKPAGDALAGAAVLKPVGSEPLSSPSPAHEQPAAVVDSGETGAPATPEPPLQSQPVEPAPSIEKPKQSSGQLRQIGSRKLTTPISWTDADGNVHHEFSAGIVHSQVSGINALIKDNLQGQQYVREVVSHILSDRSEGEKPLLRGLTSEEAERIQDVLMNYSEWPLPAELFPKQLTWEQAHAEFGRVVTQLGRAEFLPEAEALFAARFNKLRMEDMKPNDVLESAHQLRRLYRENPANVERALQMAREHAREQFEV